MENTEQAFLQVMASRKQIGQLRERRSIARPHSPFKDSDQLEELVRQLASLFSENRENERIAMEKQFLTLQEVADIIQVHRSTMKRMMDEGSGPAYYKLGGSIRIRISDFEEWLASQKSNSSTDSDDG